MASCLVGVLLGDFVVYFLGYFYGEKVLSFPLTRRLLTRQREAQIKGYFHRHGFKILVSGRFVPGFRTAAYLTAGILKLPALKLLLTDLVAATLSTSLMFGLGYLFAHQIQKGIREVQQWITVMVAVGVGAWCYTAITGPGGAPGSRWARRVLEADEVPLPPPERRAGADRASPPCAGPPIVEGRSRRRSSPKRRIAPSCPRRPDIPRAGGHRLGADSGASATVVGASRDPGRGGLNDTMHGPAGGLVLPVE